MYKSRIDGRANGRSNPNYRTALLLKMIYNNGYIINWILHQISCFLIKWILQRAKNRLPLRTHPILLDEQTNH